MRFLAFASQAEMPYTPTTHHARIDIMLFSMPKRLLYILIHILIQKRHPYTRNLNSEMLRDSKNAFLHRGNV